MNATTFFSRASAGLVAAVAGFASYSHIYSVSRDAGEHQPVAAVLPLAIDGLILVATLAMLADKRAGRKPRLSARLALVFGVLATLAANIASAQPTLTARMVAAVPAISFLLAVEVLARRGKLLQVDTDPAATVPEAPAVADQPAADPWNHATEARPAATKIEPASPVVPVPEPVGAEPGASDAEQRAAARLAYRRSVKAGKPLSGAALGRQFDRSARWGVDRVTEVRAAEQKAEQRRQATAPVNGVEVPQLVDAVTR